MSTARRFATASDSIDFGAIDVAGGTPLTVLSIHARIRWDAGALAGVSGMWVSQWGNVGGNGHGWLLGVDAGHDSRNVFWLLGAGNGAYDGTGSTGNALTADGNYHSLVVTWGTPASLTQVWLDGVQVADNNSGFRVPGFNPLDMNAANLKFGEGGQAGGADAPYQMCDVGFWRSTLGPSDIALLQAGNPSSVVSPSTLLAFTDVADTQSLRRVGSTTVTGTLTGTTSVSGPTLLTPYAILVTPSAGSVTVTQAVTIATAFGPYGAPGGTVTLTPTATGGTLSPTSGAVGTTFTYTAGTVPGSYSITFANDGGLVAPVVGLTVAALPAQLRSARVCQSGKTILLQFERSSDHASSDLTALANPTIKVNGTPITLGTPLWLQASVGQGAYPWALLTVLQPARTVRIVDDQDAGFTATGAGWLSGSGWYSAYNGQFMHYTAGATDTASWTFTGLTAGAYQVAANWHAEPSFTAQARYTVHDGATTGAAVLLTADKSQAQGSQGISTRQMAWAILGNATITGSSLTVKVANQAGAGTLVADAMLIRPVTTPIAIAPGAPVTLTAAVGWATCAAGGVTPLVNLAVDNASGIPLAGPFQATPKRMEVGYNIEPAGPTQMTLYSNLYIGTPGWGDGPNQDGRGNLLDGQGGGCNITTAATNGVDQRGIASAPGLGGAGRWKLRYPAGASGAYILGTPSGSGTTLTVAVADHVAGDGKREIEYDVTPSPNSNVPLIDLYCTGSTGHAIEIYGPDHVNPLTQALTPDPAHPWNPYFLEAMRAEGVQVARGLDVLATNNSNAVDFADLSAAGDDHANPNSYIIYNTPPLASIAGTDLTGANSDGIEWFGTECSLKATFTAPHGLKTGQGVIFEGMGNLTYPAVNASGAIAGTAVTLYQGYKAYVWVRSPTVVVMAGSGMYASPGYSALPHTWNGTATPTTGQTWTFRVEGLKAGITPALFLDYCERVDCTPYYNFPHLLSDAAVAQLADAIFAALAPGRKVRIEWSNETWNFSFDQNAWCKYNGFKTGYGPYAWSGFRMAQVFAIIKARAIAAGRADDVIYVLGTQQGFAAITSYAISGANTFDPGTQIDEVAGATYHDAVYMGVPVASAFIDELDVEQMVDFAAASEMLSIGAGSDLITHIHYGYLSDLGRTVLDSNGRYVSGTRFINYEGGTQGPVGNGYGPNNWIGEWSHRVYKHPMFRDVTLSSLQRREDEDTFVFHRFIGRGHSYWENGTCWGTYPGYHTMPGVGAPTDNPEDPLAVSPYGDAMRTWAGLVSGGSGGGGSADFQFSVAMRNARLDVMASVLAVGGRLKAYTGAPPGVSNAASGTLLCTLTALSFAAASGGTKPFSATPAAAVASGTPGYIRLETAAGAVHAEFTAGVGAGEISFNTAVSAGGTVSLNSGVFTEGNA